MISFKHEPPKNGNNIEDDVEISNIEKQEEPEADQDDFQQFLFGKRANGLANAVIRPSYASNMTPGPAFEFMLPVNS